MSLFARYFGKSPDLLGREDIRTYQVYLANEKKLAPTSIHIAISALRFFFNVTQVMGGGRQAAVAEQQLNGAHVGAGLQEMDGESVPQAVRCHRFGQTGKIMRFCAGLPNCIPADRVAGAIAREEPRLWP